MPLSDHDIRSCQLYLAALTWLTRPARVEKLPLEEQAAWLAETLAGMRAVSRETESK